MYHFLAFFKTKDFFQLRLLEVKIWPQNCWLGSALWLQARYNILMLIDDWRGTVLRWSDQTLKPIDVQNRFIDTLLCLYHLKSYRELQCFLKCDLFLVFWYNISFITWYLQWSEPVNPKKNTHHIRVQPTPSITTQLDYSLAENSI